MKTVAVVTATTGRESILQAIASVQEQTYTCQHYVFVDGPCDVPEEVFDYTNTVVLPKPTGKNGIMNGGIVAASAYLVEEDYICWLDDDNWFEPEHVETLMEAIKYKQYAYSLRKLMNPDGTFWDYDDCESLGVRSELIDVNCYLMERKLACGFAPLWYHTTGTLMIGDRYMLQGLKQHNIPYGETGKYTVNYRLNPQRDLRSFFFQGNIQNRSSFPDGLPWVK